MRKGIAIHIFVFLQEEMRRPAVGDWERIPGPVHVSFC